METASTWDSFRNALCKVLGEFQPKTVFEYGPGESTIIMQDFPSVEKIMTVEHDVAWFHKWASKMGNKVNLILEQNLKAYPLYSKSRNYDLYFIDGREREVCLDLCNRPDGIVILHDAERESYQPHIKKFRYIFMEDDGHTAILTNREDYESRLERIFQ